MSFSDFLTAQKSFPVFFTVKVIPNTEKTEIFEKKEEEDFWKMRVRAIPEKGKANAEIERFFRKEFGKIIKIISGKTDRKKLIKIES